MKKDHDHRMVFTAPNVYKGPAGFYLLFDNVDTGNENDTGSTALRVPSGQYDVPRIFNDKLFDSTAGSTSTSSTTTASSATASSSTVRFNRRSRWRGASTASACSTEAPRASTSSS